MVVKLIKIAAAQDPICQPGDWNTYKPGRLNYGESLPVDYEIIGIIQVPPTIGKCVRVYRTNRNGLNRVGEFTSTKVVALTKDGFKTLNSVYRMVVLQTRSGSGPTGSEREQ